MVIEIDLTDDKIEEFIAKSIKEHLDKVKYYIGKKDAKALVRTHNYYSLRKNYIKVKDYVEL